MYEEAEVLRVVMAAQALCVCGFCAEPIFEPKDRFLVETSFASFNPIDEIRSLSFTVILSSKHICRKCVDLLKRRKTTRTKLQGMDENIQERCFSKMKKARPVENTPPVRDLHELDENMEHACMLPVCLTSTPKKAQSHAPSPTTEATEDAMPETKVTIVVEWASKTRKRVLANGLDKIGKMLCQGTFKEIAAAVWKDKHLMCCPSYSKRCAQRMCQFMFPEKEQYPSKNIKRRHVKIQLS